MDEPKIVLRDGPAGCRPGLAGGEVWEVVAVHHSFADVERKRNRGEIGDWIRDNEEAARDTGRAAT